MTTHPGVVVTLDTNLSHLHGNPHAVAVSVAQTLQAAVITHITKVTLTAIGCHTVTMDTALVTHWLADALTTAIQRYTKERQKLWFYMDFSSCINAGHQGIQ